MKLHLPHSVFLSWDRDDRDKALWFEIHDRQTCRSCGTRAEEWDPAEGGDLHAYTVEVRGCRGCQVRAGGQEHLDRHVKEYPRGSYVRLVRGTP